VTPSPGSPISPSPGAHPQASTHSCFPSKETGGSRSSKSRSNANGFRPRHQVHLGKRWANRSFNRSAAHPAKIKSRFFDALRQSASRPKNERALCSAWSRTVQLLTKTMSAGPSFWWPDTPAPAVAAPFPSYRPHSSDTQTSPHKIAKYRIQRHYTFPMFVDKVRQCGGRL
jgi:hypothetical protein